MVFVKGLVGIPDLGMDVPPLLLGKQAGLEPRHTPIPDTTLAGLLCSSGEGGYRKEVALLQWLLLLAALKQVPSLRQHPAKRRPAGRDEPRATSQAVEKPVQLTDVKIRKSGHY